MSQLEQRAPVATHEVATSRPPLEGYNTFETDHGPDRGAAPRGRRVGRAALSEVGAFAGSAPHDPLGLRGEREPADAAHARPLRQPHRRGRVPPRLARADARSASRTACTRCPGASRRPGAHVARAAMFMRLAGRGGRRLPDLDDLLGDPGAAPPARARRRVGAALHSRSHYDRARCVPAADKAGALCGMAMTEKQGGSDVRANTTVAAPLNGGGPGAEYELDRPQVVLLGADVRRVPRPRAGRGRASRASCMPRFTAGRRAQPLPHPAAQGQARQPLERLQRGRVPRRLGAAGRRGGPRRADDHRDGQPHAPRLRDRVRRRDARRRRAGDPPRRAPLGLRQARSSTSR